MDIDEAPSTSATPSLNIARTIAVNVPSTTPISEVIANFRPTKVRSLWFVWSKVET
jgi:COMPASS component SWD2